MKVVELDHPIIKHKISIIRDKNTGTKEFREIISEVASVLCYEAMRDAPVEYVEIDTPIKHITTEKFDENNYVFLPILRAGLGMVDGILKMIPNAKIGHIGMYRDEETFKPVEYFFKVPNDIENKTVIVLDPMLATGGSAIDAIDVLKKNNVKNIKFLCIIAAPDGIKALQEKHSDVEIYTASIDEGLNENKYIVPGLGDAGDRIFGTN